MTRALLITNPFAARAHARAVTTIRDILEGGGWSVEVRSTNGPGDARRIAEESRAMGFDVLVSHGGDGTAMQVAAGIAGTGIALGLVPGGTGNVLAGNLRLPNDPANAARVIAEGMRRPIDIGRIERPEGTRHFAVASGAGVDASRVGVTAFARRELAVSRRRPGAVDRRRRSFARAAQRIAPAPAA